MAAICPCRIQNMPEEQSRRRIWSQGDGSLALIDYQGEKVCRPSRRTRRPLFQRLPRPQRAVCLRGKPAGSTLHHRQRAAVSAFPRPPGRLPRQREPWWLGGAGLRSEFQLRLLPPATHRGSDHRLFRRAFHLAQGRRRLRAAKRARAGASSRCKAPTTSTPPATTTALRSSLIAPSRPSSPQMAAPPIF